ncbi:hypothetical protein BDR26DRAFT_849416 [Obelidium mucronatum]|nr:hypothetical protein BDR26DRAFT_849416 [Obelidium mucronatum]
MKIVNYFYIPTTLLIWLYSWRLNSMARTRLKDGASGLDQPGLQKTAESHSNSISPLLGDSAENLFTFIQISDIHISRSNPVGGLPHFASFLQHELPAIAPKLVLLTGDLIDAKTPSKLISTQFLDEWVAYESILNDSKVSLRNNFYFDQRGNHDCFNVDLFDEEGFRRSQFARFSKVKEMGYSFDLTLGFGVYSFGALDACPAAGMSRPINFFGTLDSGDMNALASIVDKSKTHNHTFIFTHYPTSTMVMGTSSDGRTFHDLSKGVSMWVSGHLHKLIGNLTMYGYHSSVNLLELELGDMKDNGLYRIVAVDHDFIAVSDQVLSIAGGVPKRVSHDIKTGPLPFPVPDDVAHPREPLILITNPRDARFATPTHEPIHKILTSTHIRLLIYSFSQSKTPIHPSNITISIDGTQITSTSEYKGSSKPWSSIQAINETQNHLPLYVAKWDPQHWNDGNDHLLQVVAVDEAGYGATKTIVFRVDGYRAKSHGMESGVGGYIIAAHFENLLKGLFVFAHLVITSLVLIPKIARDKLTLENRYTTTRASLTRKLHSLNSHSPLLTRSPSTSTLLDNMESGATPPRSITPSSSSSSPSTSPLSYLSTTLSKNLERLFILWTLRFLNFANTPSLFNPFYIYLNYILVGPWFIGNLVPSAKSVSRRVGFFYVYGIWFPKGVGEWVPILDTWYIALWEHTFFIFPLLLILAYNAPPPVRTKTRQSNPSSSSSFHVLFTLASTIYTQILPFLAFTIWISLATYFGFFGWTYGYVSVFVSPGKMWMTGWAVWVLAGGGGGGQRVWTGGVFRWCGGGGSGRGGRFSGNAAEIEDDDDQDFEQDERVSNLASIGIGSGGGGGGGGDEEIVGNTTIRRRT